jgi:hypothetical protein
MEIKTNEKAQKGAGRTAILAMLIAVSSFVAIMSMPALAQAITSSPCIAFESNPPLYSGSCLLTTVSQIQGDGNAVTMAGLLSI